MAEKQSLPTVQPSIESNTQSASSSQHSLLSLLGLCLTSFGEKVFPVSGLTIWLLRRKSLTLEQTWAYGLVLCVVAIIFQLVIPVMQKGNEEDRARNRMTASLVKTVGSCCGICYGVYYGMGFS